MMLAPVFVDVPDTVTTERLLLRSPRRGDGEVLHEAIAESLNELREFLASLPWVAVEQTVETAELYCRTSEANFLGRKDLPYLVFTRDSGRLVGATGLHRTHWEVPKTEIGYWVRTSESGKGYITEAVNALVDVAFGAMAAERIEIVTDEANGPSRRVAERCGFQLDGVLRNHRRDPRGGLRNSCIYSLLRPAG